MTKLFSILEVLQETRKGKATFLLLLAVWYLQISQQTIKVDEGEN